MRRTAPVVVCVTLTVVAFAAENPVAFAVGDNPPSVVVQGVEYFSPKQVTNQLERVLWFQAVYGTAYGWEDPTITLPHVTIEAYRKAGFRDIAVRARLDPATGTIELNVDEGRRFIAGKVQVEGATQIAAERIIARLAERIEPRDAKFDTFVFQDGQFQPLWLNEKGEKVELEAPLWSSGDAVAFDVSGNLLLADRLTDVFTDLGYPQAKARVETHAAADGVLDLVVHIDNDGPRLTAHTIEVSGLERNTREDILAFLQIQPGDPLDRAVRVDVHRRLWLSARFASIAVAAERSDSALAATLRITVEEYEKAPPLRQELAEAEKVMLRLHEWLARLRQSDTALKFHTDADDAGFNILFAPGRALAVQAAGVRVLLTPDQMDYYSDIQKRKLQMKVAAKWFDGAVGLNLAKDRSEGKTLYDLKFWWFYSSEPDPNSGSVRDFGMRVSPVLCLALLNGRATEHAIDDGVLSIRSPKESLRMEAATGRLLDFHLLGDERTRAATIEFVEVPQDQFQATLWPEVASYDDAMAPMRPVSSITRLLAGDWETLSQLMEKKPAFLDNYPPELQRLFVALADHALLNTIDDFIQQAWSESQGDPARPRFKISDLTPYLKYALPKEANSWIPLVARELGNNFLSTNSWPHDAALALLSSWAGSKRMADYYWKRVLTAPGAGPLRDLIAATQLQQKEPELSHLLAVRSLALLDIDGFHRDRDALLDESAYFGRFLVHATEVLRDADPEGLDALQIHFLGRPDPGLPAALIYLRYRHDQPTWQSLPDALDAAWESHWQALVEARLRQIEAATRPKPK